MIDEKKFIKDCHEYMTFHKDLIIPMWIIQTLNEQPKVGEWILCSERIPENDGTYLCTCKELPETVSLTFSTYDNSWEDEFKSEYEPIAWMPIPEAYKG